MAGFSFSTPAWVDEINEAAPIFATIEARAAFVIEMSRRTVMEGTGVPFAAAVFEMSTGRLVALGVNLALREKSSILHAEMVAICLAERRLANGDVPISACELVSSSEPCAMCGGAIPWTGVRRLVCSARAADDRRVQFDEGDKRGDWADTYRGRGIDVITDVHRLDAVAVLEAYTTPGTDLYAARQRAGLGL
ncbi:hypothetical protein AEAC466_01455 [Asticcacaulis sp. AC466]|uniref:nucleoside deaminase n=1 Tax=Asticcacaulis sp. AC466 TaxID=1282362 RepID=UPI0003C40D5C|nr:nucleoside deaminase [Asticcacaulis sp. AC466]ESQ85872.1 hypothetical protein AEAC466_01455 [Asticcacaulis sp. AC466]